MTADQDRIRALAGPLLESARNGGTDSTAAFKPRPEDFARVFAEPLVEPARAYFASLWAQPVAITAKPEQSALLLYSTLSETLHESPLFPGGYKQLTDVVPGRIWLAWKYVRPGETMGMAYDGLVWLDDRFAWFPKAWRLLKKPSDPFYVD